MEPTLPVARALAVAGDRIAGGVGTHETALASPDVVDLGGRCVLPGFTDAHVHFVGWAQALRQARFEGTRSLEEALERVRLAVAEVPPGGWLRGLPFFERLDADDALTLRVWNWIQHELVGELGSLRLASGFGSERLKLGALKAFMDGTLGSQTALLLDGGGVEITTRAELEEIVRRGAAAGFPVAVHAIGDRANRNALDAFEATRDAWQPLRLRQRIEHAQLLAPEDIPRFAQLGVAASVQFVHATSDRDLADRNWAGMTDRAYAFRSLLDAGALVANGSDAPVEELAPLAGIRAGVLRTQDERDAWHPEQALTIDQALHATCVAPAWLAGEERRRGKLLPGYAADLVVLSTDPTEDLEGCEVVATMVAGRWVFNPPPWE